MRNILTYLDKSEWFSQTEIKQFQLHRAKIIIEHAQKNCEIYKDLIVPHNLTWDIWKTIPIINKTYIQKNHNKFLAANVPDGITDIRMTQTSGSTGIPLSTYSSFQDAMINECLSIRQDRWWKVSSFNYKLGAICPSIRIIDDTLFYSSTNTISNQVKWLIDNKIERLVTLPSNLEAICNSNCQLPQLKMIQTYSETVKPSLRTIVKNIFNVPFFDVYSADELKLVASQCSITTNYHVHDEMILLEVLDQHGDQCKPGEIGEIVVTLLHNFVMPLIRYRNGDYAEVGEPCICGRHLTTLSRIMGRERNMLTLPSGDKFWPSFPIENWLKITKKILQLQLIQKTVFDIEINLNVSEPISHDEEHQILNMLRDKFEYDFNFKFNYNIIMPSINGKFEDFISLIE